jgi:uncharacterized protein
MNALVPFSLPIQGLRDGVHEFRFEIGQDFFSCFEAVPFSDGQIEMDLVLDKRPSLIVLEFDFSGTVRTECDRCLAEIDLPIEGFQRLVVKYSEEEESDDADVWYVHPEAEELNVAQFAYEYIVLAVPMVRVYDCELENPPVCDFEMLDFLKKQQEADDAGESSDNPAWKELKNWKDEH